MTEPNTRRQPYQQRDVAQRESRTEVVERRQRQLEQRRESIGHVAQIVKTSARDFERLLPEHIPAAAFLSAAGAALWKSQDLMDGAIANPEALLIALRESAMLGHLPGTDHYWLTPRKERGFQSVLGIEGYQGIIERMYRSGGVLSVHSDVVRANDMFELWAGPNGRPLHKYAGGRGVFSTREERGEVIGVFAYAMLPGNAPSEVVLLSLEDLMEIKAKAASPSIWNAWPIPMFRKSALRRLEPYVPVSAGYRQTITQAQAFVAAAAPQVPLARMEDEDAPPAPDGGQVVEGVVDESTTPGAGDRPVTGVPYDAREWGGDPDWENLSVARPGEGVPPEVRGNA